MCRNCALPEWGEPMKIPVKELPAFFAKQISWNFERLNYGGGAVMETVSGRPERPSVTGRLGCRLREGMQPPSRGKRTERYLLVSECLYCPGKRYGCTPRANCTGKRRNCYAMCKVTVYADAPDMAEVSFSGSHGTGNVTDPSLHRPSHEGKKRRLADEESSDLGQVSCSVVSFAAVIRVVTQRSSPLIASFAAVFRIVPPHKRLLNRAIHSFPIVLPTRQSNQSRPRKESF